MSVIRINKSRDYVVMCNYHLREKEMSLKAKGLLSVMLSLPDEWEYSISGITAICKENETAIKSALAELQQFGYLRVTKLFPNQTKSGRIEYIYDIFEKARDRDVQETKEQSQEFQGIENLHVETQGVENQGQLNIKGLNINKTNINKTNTIDILNCYESNNNTLNNLNNNTPPTPSLRGEQEPKNKDAINYQEIVDMYNSICVSLPSVRSLSNARRKAIKARINSGMKPEDFRELFTLAEQSDFLKGKNNNNWNATFDWLIKDSSVAKVLDGNYKNKDNTRTSSVGQSSRYDDIDNMFRRVKERMDNGELNFFGTEAN